jgi:uncharacterized membrane protein
MMRMGLRNALGVAAIVLLALTILIVFVSKTDRRWLMRIDSPGETNIEASVTIRRPVEEVFGFYRDFRNLPTFSVMSRQSSQPVRQGIDG